jgi:chromosome segregation ATPase
VEELAGLRERLGAAQGEAETLREGIAAARAQAMSERAARERAERELTFLQGQEAALRVELAAEREQASVAAKLDAAVRLELDRVKIERETIQKLGFLGRLAWAFKK